MILPTTSAEVASTRLVAQPFEAFLLMSAEPPVERLAGDLVGAARLSNVAGRFLGVTENRQTVLHQPLVISLSHRSPLSVGEPNV